MPRRWVNSVGDNAERPLAGTRGYGLVAWWRQRADGLHGFGAAIVGSELPRADELKVPALTGRATRQHAISGPMREAEAIRRSCWCKISPIREILFTGKNGLRG